MPKQRSSAKDILLPLHELFDEAPQRRVFEESEILRSMVCFKTLLRDCI